MGRQSLAILRVFELFFGPNDDSLSQGYRALILFARHRLFCSGVSCSKSVIRQNYRFIKLIWHDQAVLAQTGEQLLNTVDIPERPSVPAIDGLACRR